MMTCRHIPSSPQANGRDLPIHSPFLNLLSPSHPLPFFTQRQAESFFDALLEVGFFFYLSCCPPTSTRVSCTYPRPLRDLSTKSFPSHHPDRSKSHTCRSIFPPGAFPIPRRKLSPSSSKTTILTPRPSSLFKGVYFVFNPNFLLLQRRI